MGMTAVNVAIPALADDLQASAVKVAWLPTVYILSNVAFLLPVGKLADMYGRKRMYVGGLILNSIAALFCTFSSNIDVILFWRFVQGIAAAMIFGTGVAIVSSIVPDKKRGMALGIVASCVYFGLTLAPALGGYLTELYGWRAVFFFQVPPIVLLIGFILLYLKGEWRHAIKGRYDINGTFLFVAFTTCLVFGLSFITESQGLSVFVLSLFLLAVFIFHQSRQKHPLIRVQLFKENRLFSLSLLSSFFMYGSNFALLFYLVYISNLFLATHHLKRVISYFYRLWQWLSWHHLQVNWQIVLILALWPH
jgi:MFS family permease